jgi:hypothetical protein
MTTATACLPDLLLTVQQQRFFDTFGYLHLPRLIKDIIPQVTEDFETIWKEHGGGHAGKDHDGSARSCIVPFIDQNERLSMLLDDPRIRGIAVSLLGEDFNYMAGDGNYYVGDTVWHFDGEHQTHRFIKCSFYLDPLDGESGALRVVPGSHHPHGPFRKHLMDNCAPTGLDTQDAFGVHGTALPAMTLCTQPGDVVVFHHNLYHSSWNGGKRRRMFTMNLAQRFAEADVGQLQGYLSGHARFFIERNVGPAMLRVANERMMRHIEQPLANDFMLPGLVRELRQRLAEPARK